MKEAQRLGQEASQRPAWIQDLIGAIQEPHDAVAPRKAAWVLKQAAMHDNGCVVGQTGLLLATTERTSDPSVWRELLKAMLLAPQKELAGRAEELYHLGLGFCADPALPAAMVHVGVQMIEASQLPVGEDVLDVWRERGSQAETPTMARFLAKQIKRQTRL